MPNLQAGGPPLVGCPRLLIQYICSYPPYLETVSSIHNHRTRHAVVTSDPPNIGYKLMHDETVGQGERQGELMKYTIGHHSPPLVPRLRMVGLYLRTLICVRGMVLN
jgi:hypothetical protein